MLLSTDARIVFLAALLLAGARTGLTAGGPPVLQQGIYNWLEHVEWYWLFKYFLERERPNEVYTVFSGGPCGKTWLAVTNGTLALGLQQLAEKHGIPDSATFKDQLVELVSGAAPAVGEGARARLVNAAHTIVGALIDSHIWASPVNLYNNASVNHSRSAETAVAMPTEAANQSLAVRAYSGVGKIEPFQVFLLQPRGQLHTGADDALALPGYGYSTFTGPNIYLNPQGNWTDYLYDVDGVFIAGDEVVAALEVIALSRSVTPSSSP